MPDMVEEDRICRTFSHWQPFKYVMALWVSWVDPFLLWVEGESAGPTRTYTRLIKLFIRFEVEFNSS